MSEQFQNIQNTFPTNRENMMAKHTNQKVDPNMMQDNDERAQITASLAAKLSHKGKGDEMKKPFDLSSMSSSLNMAGPSSSTPTSQYMNHPNMAYAPSNLAAGDAVQHASSKLQQQASAVVIAKLLANAGVTEEQLKQLTIQDQEQIISMVQNRYTQRDIDKLIAKELRNNLQQPQQRQQQQHMVHPSLQKDPAVQAAGIKKIQNMFKQHATHAPNMEQPVNGLPSFNENKMYMGTLPTVVHPAATSLVQPNVPQQTRLVSQLSNTPVNPLVTNLFTPTIAPQMLKPHVRPQALHHQVVPGAAAPLTTTHPALLLQMQKQMYLNQMAAQQQQQHVNQVYAHAAAAQKQQQLLQQAQQQASQRLGLGMHQHPSAGTGNWNGSTSNDRVQFKNPLSQWFSGEVLRQSQFPPANNIIDSQLLFSKTHPNDPGSQKHS